MRAEQITENGRVFEIRDLNLVTSNINATYKLRWESQVSIGLHGEWVLFTIEHISGLPKFTGRWDESDFCVDIDVSGAGVDFRRKRAFSGPAKDLTVIAPSSLALS